MARTKNAGLDDLPSTRRFAEQPQTELAIPPKLGTVLIVIIDALFPKVNQMSTAFKFILTILLCCLFCAEILAAEKDTDKTAVEINGKAVLPSHGTAAGIWFYHDSERGDSPQLLLTGFPTPTPKYRITAVLYKGDTIRILPPNAEPLIFTADDFPVIIEETVTTSLDPKRQPWSFQPVACSPSPHPYIEAALIEHDWRMQDGIDTPLERRTYREAIEKMLPPMQKLVDELAVSGDDAKQFETLKNSNVFNEDRWRELHRLRRKITFSNPLFPSEPLLFAKHVPSAMSHQLTQTYGYAARPGGGLFVLEEPGKSMRLTSLTAGKFPDGSYAHPEVSFDGKKIYFAFCEAPTAPQKWRDPETMHRRYHLYEMNSDGSGLRQLTNGEFDDFNPTCLPDGKLVFISTRRGGYHRCGGGPCYVYTLATLAPNENDKMPRVISFHETNEWDPAVLNDGRIIYTRWDYVDRDAVFYQQLWTTRQDGTNARIFFGNNTFVPCGIWEARQIPNSSKVMAVAAPHHGMSAGSIIMLDTSLGVDGEKPITRLTPDVRFPEAETLLACGIALPAPTDFDSPVSRHWDAVNRPDRPGYRETVQPEQERRWKGHCYKAPLPLSEKFFLVSYSYDLLRGEAGPNIPNMFGIYYVDAFGNKELLYRDPNISSVWVKPLAPRFAPPVTAGTDKYSKSASATFSMQNVYESWPKLPDGEENRITALRIVEVLPKTTPNANNPMVGAANASPGKQVLGTIPVEKDGSAYFECPAETPVLFQALDSRGRAVQLMRSLTYLQPGENTSCVGCHEHRMQTFASARPPLAMQRQPSEIIPAPEGSKPLSYPLLVQPVLERHCVSCHGETAKEKGGNIVLTGEPEGHYTKSYNVLIKHVSYTAWGMPNGNYEPITEPNRFGSRASALVKLLDDGHYDVKLSDDDWTRLNTWIDGANALFYGTFDPQEQRKQQLGGRIGE
ncbi:MAG: hypothetical protein FWE67_03905 [Planctomycetaceae bacterium]|nr:hypothetical protein [Planctomycetaceae bacterium]